MHSRLKVCLNGSRRPGEHPALPLDPPALAVAARDAVAAGADGIHLHPRDPGGVESLAVEHVGAAVAAVRRACPDVPIGVSTGAWITGGDTRARERAVRAWTGLTSLQRPDFASVNLSEPGAVELVGSLRAVGIGVEVGVWSGPDTDVLAGLAPRSVFRVLVEVIGAPSPAAEQAVRTVTPLLARLAEPGARPDGVESVLLHGEGAACWPLVAHAGRLGLPTRIGLEDVLSGPSGEPVADNAELVRLAAALWQQHRQAGEG